MTTIKSFTDLSQSKKLAEILPLESADMTYIGSELIPYPYCESKFKGEDNVYPAWSLAALLGVIPKHIDEFNVLRIDISTNDFAIWYDEIGFGVNNDLPDITKESAVDACVIMIEKLHELNLL